MIRVADFTVNCGCRSAGECRHNMFAETTAFDAVVDAFAVEMKRKFRLKWMEGRSGWDDPENCAGMRASMVEHAMRGGRQEIDVANLAAMIWNLKEGT